MGPKSEQPGGQNSISLLPLLLSLLTSALEPSHVPPPFVIASPVCSHPSPGSADCVLPETKRPFCGDEGGWALWPWPFCPSRALVSAARTSEQATLSRPCFRFLLCPRFPSSPQPTARPPFICLCSPVSLSQTLPFSPSTWRERHVPRSGERKGKILGPLIVRGMSLAPSSSLTEQRVASGRATDGLDRSAPTQRTLCPPAACDAVFSLLVLSVLH